MTLSAEGFAATSIAETWIAAGTPTVISITMERGITIAGKVTDKEGNPVVGAPVVVGI